LHFLKEEKTFLTEYQKHFLVLNRLLHSS